MTAEKTILWCLRAYQPCSCAELIRASKLDREAAFGALTRLRAKGLAERCMRARYRLTEAGEKKLRPDVNQAFLEFMGIDGKVKTDG